MYPCLSISTNDTLNSHLATGSQPFFPYSVVPTPTKTTLHIVNRRMQVSRGQSAAWHCSQLFAQCLIKFLKKSKHIINTCQKLLNRCIFFLSLCHKLAYSTNHRQLVMGAKARTVVLNTTFSLVHYL